MKVVMIRHFSNSTSYAFETAKDIKVGDVVRVNTKHGEAMGVAVCDSFDIGDKVESFAKLWSASLPLKTVVSIYREVKE